MNNDKVLVAYIVAGTEIDRASLRSWLQGRLPEYMVPGFFVALDSLPISPGGKLNRKALPAISGEMMPGWEYVAPGNPVEETLVEIWQEILGMEKIGVTNNFFDLGGHSLNIMRMTYRIEEAFRVKINMKEVFRLLTIRELAAAINEEMLFKAGVNFNNTAINTNNKNTEVWEL